MGASARRAWAAIGKPGSKYANQWETVLIWDSPQARDSVKGNVGGTSPSLTNWIRKVVSAIICGRPSSGFFDSASDGAPRGLPWEAVRAHRHRANHPRCRWVYGHADAKPW